MSSDSSAPSSDRAGDASVAADQTAADAVAVRLGEMRAGADAAEAELAALERRLGRETADLATRLQAIEALGEAAAWQGPVWEAVRDVMYPTRTSDGSGGDG